MILDIMMPRMNGIHMVMELRKEYDFPIIDYNVQRTNKLSDLGY